MLILDRIILDGPVKSRKKDGKVKSTSLKHREFRVMMRTYRMPPVQRDEAQRRNRTFYEDIIPATENNRNDLP
jgi:hypothetical protein